MGKYLPIIVTADCGSLTQAGKILGYAQPNMGSIVNRFEKELGVQLFHRSRYGVTLTEMGEKLLPIMRQIDNMEGYLQEAATNTRKERFRVGVFQRVAAQWMPQLVAEFFQKYPDMTVQMEYLDRGLDIESAVRAHRLDCAFFRGTNFPEGMQHIPLLTDPFYLLVPADSPLSSASSLSLTEVAGKYPYIHSNEVFDWEEPNRDTDQKLMEHDVVKVSSPEDSAVIALVSQGVGVSLMPGLGLCSISPAHQVKTIPLEDGPVCTISLLLPKETERSSPTTFFLNILRNRVSQWEIPPDSISYGTI